MFPVTYYCKNWYEPIKLFLPFTVRWCVVQYCHMPNFRWCEKKISPAEHVLAFPPKIKLYDIFVQLHFFDGCLDIWFIFLHICIFSSHHIRYVFVVCYHSRISRCGIIHFCAELELFSFDLIVLSSIVKSCNSPTNCFSSGRNILVRSNIV